jgi:hypothetical protein
MPSHTISHTPTPTYVQYGGGTIHTRSTTPTSVPSVVLVATMLTKLSTYIEICIHFGTIYTVGVPLKLCGFLVPRERNVSAAVRRTDLGWVLRMYGVTS